MLQSGLLLLSRVVITITVVRGCCLGAEEALRRSDNHVIVRVVMIRVITARVEVIIHSNILISHLGAEDALRRSDNYVMIRVVTLL